MPRDYELIPGYRELLPKVEVERLARIKLLDWMEGPCPHTDELTHLRRGACDLCMAELKKEVGGEQCLKGGVLSAGS